jgi:hypothetical protein
MQHKGFWKHFGWSRVEKWARSSRNDGWCGQSFGWSQVDLWTRLGRYCGYCEPEANVHGSEFHNITQSKYCLTVTRGCSGWPINSSKSGEGVLWIFHAGGFHCRSSQYHPDVIGGAWAWREWRWGVIMPCWFLFVWTWSSVYWRWRKMESRQQRQAMWDLRIGDYSQSP